MMKTDGIRIHARKGSPLQEKLEFLSMPEPNSGCLLWLGPVNSGGYPKVVWRNNKTERGNRVVWEMNHGPIPEGQHVLHKCDVRGCVNIDHLFLGTNDDNVADMMAKGRHDCGRGEKNASAKLTVPRVQRIRRGNEAATMLAEEFGVSAGQVRKVRNGIDWPGVT